MASRAGGDMSCILHVTGPHGAYVNIDTFAHVLGLCKVQWRADAELSNGTYFRLYVHAQFPQSLFA